MSSVHTPSVAVVAVSLLVALAVGAASAHEGAFPPQGPGELERGQAPPSAFELEDLDGEPHALAEVLGRRPILLVFFRGAW